MLRKFLGTFFLIIVMVSASFASAVADDSGPLEPLTPAPSAETGEMTNETPTLWFVEFSSAPTASGGSIVKTKADKKNFRDTAKKYGLQYSERYAFDTLWNGMSIIIKPGDVNKLSIMPGVKAVYPVGITRIPDTQTVEPDLFTALAMTGADVAQSDLGFTGAGVKVAVMDTGIDYDHPDLGGCFGPGCRVVTGYDFVGDAYNADPTSPSYNPVPTPDNDPDDCNGHGTHVSGIVGANGTVVGVAPDVTFGAYRVFGCEGSVNDDIMLAAMERILADGMDVLNMSIGDAFGWPQYPTAQASDRLVNKGIVVVASIGNSGANGLYSAGAPGLGKDVIGVASFDNTHNTGPLFEVNGTDIGYFPMSFSGPVPTSGTAEIVYVGRGCTADLPLLANPTGKTALVVRGVCSFGEKATNAINAGATAVAIYNSSPGNFSGTLGGTIGDGSVPVVSIARADGLFIRAQAAPVMMTWTDRIGSFPNPNGGLISSFSSYGLSPDLSLKPDIGAPGGNIYSTYPLEEGGYATLSGTSMASPHVAGAVALLLEAKPNLKATEVRDILQNSADPKLWSLAPVYGLLDEVHRQGAGMLDIDDAILATTTITPGKIATGEGEAGPFIQKLTVENSGDSAVTYDLSYENAISTEGVLTADDYWDSDASVSFSASSVTVPAHNKTTVTATITPATYPVTGQYGGYIVFTPQGGGQVYRVPFAGFVGDYQGIQALTHPFGLPALGWTPDGTNFGFASPGDIFTLQGFDMPYILIHFEHQVQVFQVRIFNANGKPVHPVHNLGFKLEYLPRNSTTTGFFAYAWDGTRLQDNGNDKVKVVPDGQYYLVVEALKANGDAKNPAHWETWTSPLFTIDRP